LGTGNQVSERRATGTEGMGSGPNDDSSNIASDTSANTSEDPGLEEGEHEAGLEPKLQSIHKRQSYCLYDLKFSHSCLRIHPLIQKAILQYGGREVSFNKENIDYVILDHRQSVYDLPRRKNKGAIELSPEDFCDLVASEPAYGRKHTTQNDEQPLSKTRRIPLPHPPALPLWLLGAIERTQEVFPTTRFECQMFLNRSSSRHLEVGGYSGEYISIEDRPYALYSFYEDCDGKSFHVGSSEIMSALRSHLQVMRAGGELPLGWPKSPLKGGSHEFL